MPATDDIPALESWLREKALEAHNEAERCKAKRESALTTEERVAALCQMREYKRAEDAFNEVITKIQNGRINQRPHVRGVEGE